MSVTPEITRDVARNVLDVIDAGVVDGLGEPVPGQMCVEAAVCYALGLPHSDNPPCVAPAARAVTIVLNDCAWSSPEARAKGMRRLAIAQLGSAGHLGELAFARRLVDYAIRVSVPSALRAAAALHDDAEHKVALIAAAERCERVAMATAPDTVSAAVEVAETAADASDDNTEASYAARDAAEYAARAAEFVARGAEYAALAAEYADLAEIAAEAAAEAAAWAAEAAAEYAAQAETKATARTAYDEFLSTYAEAVVQILIDMGAPGCQWLDLTAAEGSRQ